MNLNDVGMCFQASFEILNDNSTTLTDKILWAVKLFIVLVLLEKITRKLNN